MTNGAHPAHAPVRFGDFEVDFKAGELRKQDVRVKLQEQPFQVLRVLLEHRGEVVSREALRQRIWPADTFVDFDQGLNNAVKRLREALGDSSEKPEFIETVPRRGYRFIGMIRSGKPVAIGHIQSLVVLPLENLSGDPEQEYFADGLTEAMISELAKVKGLRVISRMTAMFYKSVRRPLREVARELGVDAVVEGTVVRSGNRVRISVQLIEGRTDTHVWAEAYDRDLREILSLYSELALAVANQVRLKAGHSTTPIVDPQAYEAYLKGRHQWYKRTADGLTKAKEYFERAMEIDRSYVAAYAGLADVFAASLFWGFLPPQKAFSGATAFAQRALALDESMAEPHAALGFSLQHFDFDFPAAEREFRRCIELSPGYSVGRLWYGACLCAMGRFDGAFSEAREAIQLDPLSVILRWATSHYFVHGREYDAAMEEARIAMEIDPNLPMTRMIMGIVSEVRGNCGTAISEFQEAVRLSGGTPLQLCLLARAYGCACQRDDALRVLSRVRELSPDIYVMPYWIALAYAGLEEKDEALRWLNKGYVTRAAWMTYIKVDPRWDTLRSDSRFQELLNKISFPKA